ncbi:MAG: flagellar biosynthetic protein FliO [Roseibium sp.]
MYNWIETTLNVSGSVTQIIAVILALAVVLLLFALFIFILKRLTGNQSTQSRNRQPRIAVMDSATIDTRRRLVLIRRDNIEHLILVGGPSDVVVEQNIVRNTPLTQAQKQAMPQARSGQHPGSGIGGTSAMRSPMAPGPDIPARPDDTVANGETAPPSPAMLARAPAPAPAPTPTPVPTPLAAPVAASVAASTPEAPAGAADTRPQTASATGSGPESQGRTQAARTPLPIRAKTEAGRESGQASDLLKAATRNGFNKSVTKGPATDNAPDNPPPTPPASPVAAAPVVRPASQAPISKSPAVPPAQPETRAGAALKSLARPFSPRDRPSYGTHSITPPASGPAARAKTALMKPTEPEQPADAGGSNLAASPPPHISEAQASAVQAKDAVRLAGAAPGETSPEQAQPVTAGTASDVPKPDPAPVVTAEPAMMPKDAPKGSDESANGGTDGEELSPTLLATAGTASPNPERKQDLAHEPAPVVAVPKDIKLDPDDLLEDLPAAVAEAAETGAAETRAPETGATETGTKVKATAPEQDQDQSSSVKAPDGPVGDESPSNGGTDQKGSAPPVKAVSQPAAGPAAGAKPGLGDKNPIEEEMAKILDELGGHPN